MKLVIQIPCLNERDQLPETLEDLPRQIDGIDEIEILIIDDGSTDGTAEIAEAAGVHHIVRFPKNRGLSAAHMAGLDAGLRLGADIVVNTDADNQYPGKDIARLVRPILDGEADIVIGDRQTDTIAHFSPIKRLLQREGSRLVRRASGTRVADSTSGFRAMNRKALTQLFVHNKFTYTLETIIQAGARGLVIENVAIQTNAATRPSRLFKGIVQYLRRNGPVIFRSYGMYWPVQTFGLIALLLALPSLFLIGRFLVAYFQNPDQSQYIQSLSLGVGGLVLAFIVGIMAFVGDLLATNRRLSEEILHRVRRIDAILADDQRERADTLDGIHHTGAAPWRPSAAAEGAGTPAPSEPAVVASNDGEGTAA